MRLFQSLVQQDEAVLFPVQALDTVSPPPAEQEQGIGKRVGPVDKGGEYVRSMVE